MKRLTTRSIATAQAIANREDFRTSGALMGESCSLGSFDRGRLTGADLDRFNADCKNITYVVKSYATPIAWYVTPTDTDKGGWYKVKAKFSGKRIGLTIKAKPLKSKKVKATVVVYEVKGKRANGELKLKKIGKGKVKKGVGSVTLKKALGKGKHKGPPGMAPKGMPEAEDEAEDMGVSDEDYASAAGEVRSALDSGDDAKLARSLRAFIDLCGSDMSEPEIEDAADD